MKEKYCYTLFKKWISSKGWIYKCPDSPVIKVHRPDFIWLYKGKPHIIEIKVQRTKRNFSIVKDVDPKQLLYYIGISKSAKIPIDFIVYKAGKKHKRGRHDRHLRLTKRVKECSKTQNKSCDICR